IFNGRLSYRKGAAMLHLLRFELNDDGLFFQIMEDFLQTFAHDVATGDDFRMTVDLNTGKNWEWFFNQWYYGEGYPIYELMWWQEDNNLFIRSSQTTSTNFPLFFSGTLEFKVRVDDQEEYIRMFQNEPLQVFEIPLNGKVEDIVFDPRSYMLKDFVLMDSTGTTFPDKISDLTIGPNPVEETLTVYFDNKWNNAYFFVSDLQGRNRLEGRFTNDRHTIYMAGLTTGVYLIKVVSFRGDHKSLKFFKK
ncbi:MAG: T9SS type A sorting domain-containing protein, partial [Bacteroidales bacterium]|nr:T9SS type A sorting domain-containing protein [Bacteroidales bacterium]